MLGSRTYFMMHRVRLETPMEIGLSCTVWAGCEREGHLDGIGVYTRSLCRDAQRTVAPLKPADDAVLIDTTGIGIEDVVARVMDLLPVPAA